jgi:hypothetical protein
MKTTGFRRYFSAGHFSAFSPDFSRVSGVIVIPYRQ